VYPDRKKLRGTARSKRREFIGVYDASGGRSVMRTVDLAGTSGEMGRRYGQLLERAGFSPRPIDDGTRRFVRECRPAVKEHAPWLLEELRGVAVAGGWSVETIEATALALGSEFGCSVVALSSECTGGRTLFGRNYDFYPAFADVAELFRTAPEGRLASVGCSDHWVGRHDGINEAGLAIGHTFVSGTETEPGVAFALATRAVLDTCRSVSEAVAFLERLPHTRTTAFLVADRTGEMAVVEAASGGVETRGEEGAAVATNHFRSGTMAAHEAAGDRSSSERRFDALERWIERSRESETRIGVEELREVLSRTERGVCACVTGSEEAETLWSWAADLDGPTASLARGRPDGTPYEPVGMP
jgi:predicted choloylglycine hydrolase